MGLGIPNPGGILDPEKVHDITIQKTDLGRTKMHTSDTIENELDWAAYNDNVHGNQKLMAKPFRKELDTSDNDHEEEGHGGEEELDLSSSSSSSDSEFEEIRSFGSQSTLSRTPSPVLASEIGFTEDSSAAACFGDYNRSACDMNVCSDNEMTDDGSEGATCDQILIVQMDRSSGVVNTKNCVDTAANTDFCRAPMLRKVQQHGSGSVLPAANEAAIELTKGSEEMLLTSSTLEESFLGSYVLVETPDLDGSELSTDSDSEDDSHSFSSATTLTGSPPPGWTGDFEDEVYENANESQSSTAKDDHILQSPSVLSTINTDEIFWEKYPLTDVTRRGDSSKVRACTDSQESSQVKGIDSEDSLPAPVTVSVEGRKLEALISPFVHMDRIFWLVKLQDSSAVEIIPGSLVNTYFFQDVIRFYEQKLTFISGEPKVVLRIQDIDAHTYE